MCTCDGHTLGLSAAAETCFQDGLRSDTVLGPRLEVGDLQQCLLSRNRVDGSLQQREETSVQNESVQRTNVSEMEEEEWMGRRYQEERREGVTKETLRPGARGLSSKRSHGQQQSEEAGGTPPEEHHPPPPPSSSAPSELLLTTSHVC